MRYFLPMVATLGLGGAVAACASFAGTSSSTDPSPHDAGSEEPSLPLVTDVPVPEGCDVAAEPKDAPKCVVSELGVFVDATKGAEGNPGTKDAPLKSIAAALGKLAGKTRVYVCEGTYPEHVKLTAPVSLYGGFRCGAWTYSGAKTTVAPSDPGYALEVASTTADVTIADLGFVAPSANDKGQSSIAAFVHNASKLTFLRSALEAGNAKEGAEGATGTTGAPTVGDLKGNAASGTTAGAVKTCACSSGGMSTGGAGGPPQNAGARGAPSLGGAAPVDGIGGVGNVNCGAGGLGHTGADATAAAEAAKMTALGSLDANGWTPQAGNAGPSGTPGQGGGGGGGRDATSAGGGGACGGCGGTGGKPGAGGGASVALLSLDSAVALRATTLTAKAAGPGGAGGAKGSGAAGGTAGGSIGGCGAGDGGRGGDGGSGSGGAGGISAAVLHKGIAPTNDGSTLNPGAKGTKGTGGAPGTNDGPDGQAAAILAVQ